MAGILDFSQYIGGADNIEIEQIFPSSQRTVSYNFGTDITGWTFHVDYQPVVANSIAFDRATGAPNFAGTQIIGYFPSGVISTATNVNVLNTATGLVAVTFPANLYTGPVLPDARSHNPIVVIGVTWTDGSTPAVIETHRWAFIQAWEPGINPGDPVLSEDYTSITVGF